MSGKDVERSDEREYDAGPWWAGLGTWGAVGLIAFGVAAAAWLFFRLPGAPETSATGYYMAAKVVAVGLVVVGGSVLGRLRARGGAAEKARESGRGRPVGRPRP